MLRGLSILSVVLLHIDIRIPLAQSSFGLLVPREVSRVFVRSGYYGVKVFLVLSGFLITATLLRRWHSPRRLDIAAFYQMRVGRIVPCLLALLATLSMLHLAGAPGFVITRTSLSRALLAAFSFRINHLEIAVGYLPACWDVLWSLSVEEVFYLAYPLLLKYVRIPWLLVVGAVLLTVAGPLARTTWAGGELDAEYSYLANMDCIALGCLAAFAVRRWPAPMWVLRTMQAIGLSLVLLVVVSRGTATRLGLTVMGLDVTVLALGIAFILWGLVGVPHGRLASGRVLAPVRWLGQQSYEIYLTHSFLTVWGAQLFVALGSPRGTTPLWHVGITCASAAVGWAVARVLSEPANRRIRAWGATGESRPAYPSGPRNGH